MVTPSKPLPLRTTFAFTHPLFQDIVPKTGTIIDRIRVNTQSTIPIQKSDLYDNGTMSFPCEHSPNWQVFCPQIIRFYHIVEKEFTKSNISHHDNSKVVQEYEKDTKCHK